MNKAEFKRYQTELNHRRENELKSGPKLSPVVLLGDDDFDVSLGDIPINIQEVPVPPIIHAPVKQEQTSSVSLF